MEAGILKAVDERRKGMKKRMEEQKKSEKHIPVVPVVLCTLLLAIGAAYGGGIFYYQNHFLPGTSIDRINVSGMTVEELEKEVQDYLLCIAERKADGSVLEEDIQGKEISLAYASSGPLKEFLQEQNKWMWFLPQTEAYETQGLLSWDQEKLEKEVDGLKGFEEGFANAPTDAYISDYTPERGFEILPETPGNELDRQKALETIQDAVASLAGRVDLSEAGCYKTPQVTSEDEELKQALEKLRAYENLKITYQFGENTEVVDGELVSGWLRAEGTEICLDESQVEAFVVSLRKRYDTIFRSRTFMTSYGKEITIEGGDYGWWMNYTQEIKELTEMIKRGDSGERTPVYYQTADRYGKPDYGDTYVEINLTAQHLFLYKDGNLILESDFVSGSSIRGDDTPPGVYSITYKQRNAILTNENYRTPVSYWMPFNRNIGLHDAGWRRAFGGDIYKTNGSHGCINLPPSAAKEIYENVSKGTPVICYQLPGTEAVVMEKGAPAAEIGEE